MRLVLGTALRTLVQRRLGRLRRGRLDARACIGVRLQTHRRGRLDARLRHSLGGGLWRRRARAQRRHRKLGGDVCGFGAVLKHRELRGGNRGLLLRSRPRMHLGEFLCLRLALFLQTGLGGEPRLLMALPRLLPRQLGSLPLTAECLLGRADLMRKAIRGCQRVISSNQPRSASSDALTSLSRASTC